MQAPIRVLGILVIFLLLAGCTQPLMGDDVKETPTPTPTATPAPIKVPDENTTVSVVWEGATPIKDALAISVTSKEEVLKTATETALKDVKYPYNVSVPESKTEIKILKYRCDDKMGICGYWIEATREGKEVYTNSPIWFSPPPYEVVISEIYDSKTNTNTITLVENPKLAIEQRVQSYVDRQPLGKAIVGTKE